MYKKQRLLMSLFFFSSSVYASTVSIHISESGIEQTDVGTPELQNLKTSESSAQNTTFLSKDTSHKIDVNNPTDRDALANSIEFEMYHISEDQNTHTVFEAGSGICHSFDQTKQGVRVTDTSTYYLNNQSKNEYYTNISGATVNAKTEPKNVSYAPVFSVNSQDLAKKLKEEDEQYGRNIAEKNLNERSGFLAKILCK